MPYYEIKSSKRFTQRPIFTAKSHLPHYINHNRTNADIPGLFKSTQVSQYTQVIRLFGKKSTLAFVVIPDHVYWLMQLVGNQSLANTIKTIKSKATIQIGNPIWQKGYYDHAIRKDEDIQDIARYIIANPIRAGIVERVGNYPHWDAIWL